jgi:hypothetical protein
MTDEVKQASNARSGYKKKNARPKWTGYCINETNTGLILDIIDDLTFVTNEGQLVGPTAEEILREIPEGPTLSELEGILECLQAGELIGEKRCVCGSRESRIYFRLCEHGVPMILHSPEQRSPIK